jgi:RNA polymerase sigma-70 factor (ECF subfamily)
MGLQTVQLDPTQRTADDLRSTIMGRRPPVILKSRQAGSVGSRSSLAPKTASKPSTPVIGEESKLVQQAIAGDSNALELIITKYAARLYRTAFAVLRNKEDAEDALQDSWCRAYSKLQFFEGRSSLSTWLTRIVVNSALMIRRRKNVRPEASLDEILDKRPDRLQFKIVDPSPNPEQICTITEFNGLAEQQFRQLPTGLQTAFQLYDLEGLSLADSIQALGIRKSAFKSRISRARRKLANGLRQSLQPPASRVSIMGQVGRQLPDGWSITSICSLCVFRY